MSRFDTREVHLQWCKGRALEHVEAGELVKALASMTSDTGKHPETAGHEGNELGILLMSSGHLNTREEMRRHIEGYN